MEFSSTSIPDVIMIRPKVYSDERGFFMETFQADLFAKNGLPVTFVQDNHSGSHRGTLRGLHYQIQRAQGKLIRVVAGEIFDVAVDIRRSSPTFKQWVGSRLSAESKTQLWTPEGFAYGYYVLSEWAEILYKTTDFYAPEWERCILWNDPELGIEWPLPSGHTPILSAKDKAGKLLKDADCFS
jgi:dTDP-4-dehydrorhamnose 3,5-epimerase